ncbi:MAG: HNH endonuclease [Moorea sp. SIO2B7]|nr:HNH endonuclease [Moorena sp. SIO2B7]
METSSLLTSLLRGWRNYHFYCQMDGSRFSLWFLSYRTFKVFLKHKTINRHQAAKMVKAAFPTVTYSENKFVNVKGNKSPFDGDIKYWSKRNSIFYDGATAKALRQQSHSCGLCGRQFFDDEKVELHHIDGNHNHWHRNNLLAVHRSCHQYHHMSKSWKD